MEQILPDEIMALLTCNRGAFLAIRRTCKRFSSLTPAATWPVNITIEWTNRPDEDDDADEYDEEQRTTVFTGANLGEFMARLTADMYHQIDAISVYSDGVAVLRRTADGANFACARVFARECHLIGRDIEVAILADTVDSHNDVFDTLVRAPRGYLAPTMMTPTRIVLYTADIVELDLMSNW